MTDTGATTLSDSISAFTTEMAKRASPQVLATLNAEIKKLADSGIARHALALGAKAPDFTLPDARGGKLSLSSLLAKGPAVLTFYRYGSCPFCNLQLRAYQAVVARIHDLGAELVAISAQMPDLAAADIEQKALTFPVLTDAHNQVSRQYGLVFKLSEVFQQLQTGFGSPIPKFTGDDTWELLMPGTFVVDRRGVVQLAHVDPDYRVRLEPAAILNSLQGLNG
jgi:peroxiredoxin